MTRKLLLLLEMIFEPVQCVMITTTFGSFSCACAENGSNAICQTCGQAAAQRRQPFGCTLVLEMV